MATKSTVVKLMDKLSWALAHVGRAFHGGAFRRVLGPRRNRAREEEEALDGGEWMRRVLGVSVARLGGSGRRGTSSPSRWQSASSAWPARSSVPACLRKTTNVQVGLGWLRNELGRKPGEPLFLFFCFS